MSSPILHIFSIIAIGLLFAGLAFVRLRLYTSMKTKMIIISVASITVIVIVSVILYLYLPRGD